MVRVKRGAMVRCEYSVSLANFKEAMKGYRQLSKRARFSYWFCFWVFPTIGISFGLFYSYLVFTGSMDSSWSFLLMLALVFGVSFGVPARYRMAVQRAFELRNVLAKNKPMFLEFDEERVRFVVPEGTEVSYPWSTITNYFENDQVFVVFVGEAVFHTIPKQAMSDDGWLQFRRLLSTNSRSV